MERLYGPGALAQGFFVTKRLKSGTTEINEKSKSDAPEKNFKYLSEKLNVNVEAEPTMKQSTSSPTLPVLRHLRPEFRAQLPIISPKKSSPDVCKMQKSITIPELKDEAQVHVAKHPKSKDSSGSICTTVEESSGRLRNKYLYNDVSRISIPPIKFPCASV